MKWKKLVDKLRHIILRIYRGNRQEDLQESLSSLCSIVMRACMFLEEDKKEDIDTAGIVFSMDRAMQLHALLGSYREKVTSGPPLIIIYRVTNSNQDWAYNEVFTECSDVVCRVIKQEYRESFQQMLIDVLQNLSAKNIFFLVDDNLFVEPIDIFNFASHATNYSIPTMRMGENLNRSYTVQRAQAVPVLKKIEFGKQGVSDTANDQFVAWCWNVGELDWVYPLSVDGHILQRNEVLAMAKAIEFDSPNTFEANLQQFIEAYRWRLGICCRKSRLVNLPYNRVQNDVQNIHGNVHQDYLLQKWQEGYRIDRKAYYGMVNESAHQEVPLALIHKDS